MSRDEFEEWVSDRMGEAVRGLPARDKLSTREWISVFSVALRGLAPDKDTDDADDEEDDDGVHELDFE